MTPSLETKGHKTLLKELFVYYICKRRMGREGGAFKLSVKEGVAGLIMTITRWSTTSLTASAAGLFSLHVHNSVNQAEKIENQNLSVGASRSKNKDLRCFCFWVCLHWSVGLYSRNPPSCCLRQGGKIENRPRTIHLLNKFDRERSWVQNAKKQDHLRWMYQRWSNNHLGSTDLFRS